MKNEAYDLSIYEIEKTLEIWELSEREREIVCMIMQNILTNKDIGSKLNISPLTVRNHLDNIYRKAKVHNKSDLILKLFHTVIKQKHSLKEEGVFKRSPMILIVDDEEDITELLRDELTDLGFKIFTTNDPLQVKQIVKDNPIDFIVADITMPGMNGIEVLEMVQSNMGLYPKVIFMSGQNKYKLDELYNFGAISFLSKPFKTKELSELIAENYIDRVEPRSKNLNVEYNFDIDTPITCDDNDLGLGGMFLDSEKIPMLSTGVIQKGHLIKLKLTVPKICKDESIIGEVVWNRPFRSAEKRAGLGLKFKVVSAKIRNKVSEIAKKKNVTSYIPMGVESNH